MGMMRLCPIKYGVKSGAGTADPYANYVVFLLHFEGANGSQIYTDETGKYWTGSPAEYIATDQSKFGTGSLFLDGGISNRTFISTGDAYFAASPIGTQDFCLETFAWVDPTYTTVSNRAIMGFDSAIYKFQIVHDKDHGGANGKFAGCIGSGVKEIFALSTPTLAQWYHLALVRDGNTLRFFIDGVQQGTSDVTGVSLASESACYIGSLENLIANYNPFLGRLDEARLTVGVPRYTSDFTPPTEAFIYP
jgi:hypothetical protein